MTHEMPSDSHCI